MLKKIYHLSALLLISLSMLSLTGCANTFHSQIRTVNRLPTDFNPSPQASKAYQFEFPEDLEDAPEFVHASRDVKQRLGELGFVEKAINDGSVPYRIKLELFTTISMTEVRYPLLSATYYVTPSGDVIATGSSRYRTAYPFTIFGGRGISRVVIFPNRGYHDPYFLRERGFYSNPFYTNTFNVTHLYSHMVLVSIIDTRTNKTLYSTQAHTDNYRADIMPDISLLIATALGEFPMQTGTKNLSIELEPLNKDSQASRENTLKNKSESDKK